MQSAISFEVDVIFAGKTGAGKSTLINMIMGTPNPLTGPAAVGSSPVGYTTNPASYSTSVGPGLRCKLWDTSGLFAPATSGSFLTWVVGLVRDISAISLEELILSRARFGIPILIWCVPASKIHETHLWQQFRKVYVEYCRRRALPAVVITQASEGAVGLKSRCDPFIRPLYLGIDVPITVVRSYEAVTRTQYLEDTKGLKDLISQLSTRY